MFVCTKCNASLTGNKEYPCPAALCSGYTDEEGQHDCPNRDKIDIHANPLLVLLGVALIIAVAVIAGTSLG